MLDGEQTLILPGGKGGQDIAMTLGPEQKVEAAQNLQAADKTAAHRRQIVVMTMMAAAARLQGLEAKKYPVPGEILKPMSPEDSRDYAELKKWWAGFGEAKQLQLLVTMKQLADVDAVQLLSREY